MATLCLDKQSLYTFYGDATDTIAIILNDYLHTLDTIIASFHAAFADGSDELRSVAHFHASAFTYVGFPELYTECKALEAHCRQVAHVQELQQAFDRLLAHVQQSRQLVQAELKTIEVPMH